MAERKAFPLRMDPRVFAALERWAADELRSTNGQIEYLLREALRRAGRLGEGDAQGGAQGGQNGEGGQEESG